jgi:hypothetical protein
VEKEEVLGLTEVAFLAIMAAAQKQQGDRK